MIPIRDTQQSECFPVVTYGLIALNLMVFLFQLTIGLDNEAFFYTFGLVPAKYTIPDMAVYFSNTNRFLSLFTYMFLHGGFMHFFFNMLSLYIFGDNVEEHFGPMRFVLFYIASGIISAGFHFFLNAASPVPTIGASGAIAGVMGAYFLLYPASRILTIIPIIIIPWFVEIPAFIFLGLWFLLQFFNATGSGAGSGIAWWAHIGGFIAGLVLVKLNEKIPQTGARNKVTRFTVRKKTPRLQQINTRGVNNDVDLLGAIEITSLEAVSGSKKLVNIPWGFYNRLYRVSVPPGVRQGTKLRLAGMGKADANGRRGDLFLEVMIKNAI
ncbi:MAG: rhomboid family intramembrane serine protease [Desulfobacteraceae bacterium]|nr:MAG: rhomboid family intramembrane serine protease [Desulfobacteraceae bacterium]